MFRTFMACLSPAAAVLLFALGIIYPLNKAVAQQAIGWRVNGFPQSLPLTNGARTPLAVGAVYEISFSNLPVAPFLNGDGAEFNLGFVAPNGSSNVSVVVEMFNPSAQDSFYTNRFDLDSAGWRFKDVTRTIGSFFPVKSWLGPSAQVWQSNAGSLRFTISGGKLVLRTILLRARTPETTYEVAFPATRTRLQTRSE